MRSPFRPRSLPRPVQGLWPAPAQARMTRVSRSGQCDYWIVPSARRPRLLVPVGVRGAERMLARHGGNRAARAAGAIWRAIQTSPMSARLPLTRLSITPAPEGIEEFLASAVGRPVRIGVLLGPPRANLKPVLQIFDESGATIAFAKLGLTRLPAALLANEASALQVVGNQPRQTFSAPILLYQGDWHGVPVLVQGALALSQSRRAPTRPPVDVMAEIAAIAGVETHPLGETDFYNDIAPGTDSDWHGLDLSVLTRLHGALKGAGDCPIGSWHGDFGPWNMASNGAEVEVWDWERFETGVPVGLDAAHYRTQVGVATQAEPKRAWADITTDVSAVLTKLSLPDTSATVSASYLLAICARYRHDAVDGPTPALRRRLQWIASTAEVALPFIEESAR